MQLSKLTTFILGLLGGAVLTGLLVSVSMQKGYLGADVLENAEVSEASVESTDGCRSIYGLDGPGYSCGGDCEPEYYCISAFTDEENPNIAQCDCVHGDDIDDVTLCHQTSDEGESIACGGVCLPGQTCGVGEGLFGGGCDCLPI